MNSIGLMKRITWTLFLVFTMGAAGSTTTASSQRSTVEIMQRKLDASQQLLGALVTAQFDDIKALSDELDALAEFQSWFVLPTPEYAQYTREFRASAQVISAAGSRRDISGVYEGYTSMVGTCLQCHDYIR